MALFWPLSKLGADESGGHVPERSFRPSTIEITQTRDHYPSEDSDPSGTVGHVKGPRYTLNSETIEPCGRHSVAERLVLC